MVLDNADVEDHSCTQADTEPANPIVIDGDNPSILVVGRGVPDEQSEDRPEAEAEPVLTSI